MSTSRTMTLTRRLDAPCDVVFRAWTDPKAIPQWFGPEGFYCETVDIDLREGGHWIFDMVGHGMRFHNRHRYTRIVPNERIEFLMDDGDDEAAPMEVTVLLEPDNDSTRLTHSVVFPSIEAYEAAKEYKAEELGYTTLAKLAAFLGA